MSDSSSASHLIHIKEEIASTYPDFEERVTRAWTDILDEMKKVTQEISAGGPEVSYLRCYGNACYDLTDLSPFPKSNSLSFRVFRPTRLMKYDARAVLSSGILSMTRRPSLGRSHSKISYPLIQMPTVQSLHSFKLKLVGLVSHINLQVFLKAISSSSGSSMHY